MHGAHFFVDLSVISQVSNAGPVIGRGHKSTVTLVPRRPERIEVLIERWEWIDWLKESNRWGKGKKKVDK
jgi:hypothetical protein